MGDQLLQTLIYKEVTTVCTFLFDLGIKSSGIFIPDARPNLTLRGLCILVWWKCKLLHYGVCKLKKFGSLIFLSFNFRAKKSIFNPDMWI